jgi:hypothetical protein
VHRIVVRPFHRKVYSEYIFCSFNRKILANLPTRFKKGTTLETTFMCSEYQTIVDGMDAVILHLVWITDSSRIASNDVSKCTLILTKTTKSSDTCVDMT